MRRLPFFAPLVRPGSVITWALVAGLGLAIAVAAITYRHLGALDSSQRWVARTHEAIETSHDIVLALSDAGRARRTFVETHDPVELGRYRAALARVDAARDKVRILAVDADEQRQLDEIDAVIAARRDQLDASLRDASSHPFDPATEAAFTSASIRLSGRLSTLVGQLDDDEQHRLADRTARMHADSESVERTILLGVGSSVVILLAAFVMLRREARSRQRSEQWLSTTLASITDAVLAVDGDANVSFINPTVEALLDVRAEDAIGKPIWNALQGESGMFQADGVTVMTAEESPIQRALAGEDVKDAVFFIRAGGAPEGRWYSANASPFRDPDGAIRGAVTVGRDVTELRSMMNQLAHAAVRDELTGLLNRRGFQEQAAAVLQLANRTSRPLALVYVDLNGMKAINDTFGHSVGDSALVDAADMLRKTFGAADLIARLGGDEFVVLVPEYGEDADGSALRFRFHKQLTATQALARPFRLSASLGITIYDPKQRPRTIEELLVEADGLMYAAKQRRRREGTMPMPFAER